MKPVQNAGDRPSLFRDPITYHAATLGTFMMAAAAPTSFFHFYQDAFGISPGIIAIIFAVYSLALLKALLVAGSISDHLGRRPVIFVALLLQIVAMALFVSANGPAWLIAARIVQGIATGIASASIGAALVDFDRVRGSMLNSVTLLAGMGIGALLSSVLIEFAPAPLSLTFMLLTCMFAFEAAAIWLTPETVAGKPGILASLRPRLAVPPQTRAAFGAIASLHMGNWTLAGFYMSLVPSVVISATGNRAPLTGGSVVAALLLSGAVTIYCRREKTPQANLATSVYAAIGGVATVIISVHLASVPGLVVGTILCGIGFGLNLLGCFGSVVPLANSDERAELLAAFYTLGYLCYSLPAIMAGFLVKWLGYASTADIYAVAVLVLNLAGIASVRSLSAHSHSSTV